TNLAKTIDRNAQEAQKRDLAMSLRQLALVYERLGDKTLAIETFSRAIPYLPEPSLRDRAQAYSRFGMHKEAIADADQVIAINEERYAKIKNGNPPPEFLASTAPAYRDRADLYVTAHEY